MDFDYDHLLLISSMLDSTKLKFSISCLSLFIDSKIHLNGLKNDQEWPGKSMEFADLKWLRTLQCWLDFSWPLASSNNYA